MCHGFCHVFPIRKAVLGEGVAALGDVGVVFSNSLSQLLRLETYILPPFL